MTKKVAVEVVQPVTLQDSFDIVLERLNRVQENMQASDRQVYRAVGEFAEAATATAQAAAALLQDPSLTPSSESLRDRLRERQQALRQSADEMLCTATSVAEIDLVLKTEQLLERIEQRLRQLGSESSMEHHATTDSMLYLSNLTKAELIKRAKAVGLKGYAKLTKDQLVQKLTVMKD